MNHQSEMVETARGYCRLIRRLGEGDLSGLEQMVELLPRLHAAVAALKASSETGSECTLVPDIDSRFELFTRLRAVLGEKDPYWMEYDLSGGGQTMTGSLADDLTDIFCELKRGLEMLEGHQEEPRRVLNSWCSGFKTHWGQHLVDAQRHLYTLDARKQL